MISKALGLGVRRGGRQSGGPSGLARFRRVFDRDAGFVRFVARAAGFLDVPLTPVTLRHALREVHGALGGARLAVPAIEVQVTALDELAHAEDGSDRPGTWATSATRREGARQGAHASAGRGGRRNGTVQNDRTVRPQVARALGGPSMGGGA